MAQPKNTSDSIIKEINDHKFENLDVYLKDKVDWENFGDELIVPKNARKFIKSIQDKENRIAVASFLQKYVRQYFREAAERQEYNENTKNIFTVGVPSMPVKTADARLNLLQQELLYILDQEQSTGEFSGDKFKKQKEKIKDLEKQVNDLKEENLKLKKTIYAYEHRGDGHFIPEKLICPEFEHIIQLLHQKQLIIPHNVANHYGYQQVAYLTWKGHYDLFGYFVDKVSFELELRDSGGRLNWKIFNAAFDNFKKMERAAKNAVSRYQQHPEAKMPEGAETIDEILQTAAAYEAERKMKE